MFYWNLLKLSLNIKYLFLPTLYDATLFLSRELAAEIFE